MEVLDVLEDTGGEGVKHLIGNDQNSIPVFHSVHPSNYSSLTLAKNKIFILHEIQPENLCRKRGFVQQRIEVRHYIKYKSISRRLTHYFICN